MTPQCPVLTENSSAGAAFQVAGQCALAGRLRSCKGQPLDTFTTIGLQRLNCPTLLEGPLSVSQRCLVRGLERCMSALPVWLLRTKLTWLGSGCQDQVLLAPRRRESKRINWNSQVGNVRRITRETGTGPARCSQGVQGVKVVTRNASVAYTNGVDHAELPDACD